MCRINNNYYHSNNIITINLIENIFLEIKFACDDSENESYLKLVDAYLNVIRMKKHILLTLILD